MVEKVESGRRMGPRSIYLSIYEIYIAPLQGNYFLRGAPSPGENVSFKELVK